MVDLEKLGIVAVIVAIIAIIIIGLLWWSVCFIAAGAILVWLGYTGPGFFAVQIVVWILILAITSAITRFGYNKFK